jgi:multifunctional methyltransferase subunit TRM112
LLKKLDLKAIKIAATNLSIECENLSRIDLDSPATEENFESMMASVDLLREVHHLLFEVHVLDGFLVCPESGRKFPIKDGIPNMLLHEDEV